MLQLNIVQNCSFLDLIGYEGSTMSQLAELSQYSLYLLPTCRNWNLLSIKKIILKIPNFLSKWSFQTRRRHILKWRTLNWNPLQKRPPELLPKPTQTCCPLTELTLTSKVCLKNPNCSNSEWTKRLFKNHDITLYCVTLVSELCMSSRRSTQMSCDWSRMT